jgi:hypothetical protein
MNKMKALYKYTVTFLSYLILAINPIELIAQETSINQKQYSKIHKKVKKRLTKIELGNTQYQKVKQAPLEWWKQDYLATMDPKLGRPTPEVLFSTLEKVNRNTNIIKRATPGTSSNAWQSRGPNNVGGRTRAITWDPNDSKGKKVWAGAVTGGLWYNDDITSSSSSWKSVSEIWSNITVTCIAFDPNNSNIMYVGTGEGFGTTFSTSRGAGIFKSTDGGKTFSLLSASSGFYYVNDILVRNESGSSVVYVASDILFYQGQWNGSVNNIGLMRSTDGGSSFTNVLPKAFTGASYPSAISDIKLDKNNRIWLGTRANAAFTSSDKGGGRVLYSDNGTTFTEAYKNSNGLAGRVELGVSPNNSDTLYALFESGGKADLIIRSFNGGSNWSSISEPVDADQGIPSTDFTRGQAWYDLVMSVNPKNPKEVIIGGIDLFISTNSGNSWNQLSKWSNNANLNTLNCPYVHADQHAIVYHSDGKQCLFGSDGGVSYGSNIPNNSWNSSGSIGDRNNGYLVTQFYAGTISQQKSSNFMLAGAQDNGTLGFTNSGINDKNSVSGGDGGYCFISPSSDQKQVVSYVFNNFYATTNAWQSFKEVLKDNNSGKFINPAALDDVNSLLFSGKAAGELYRNNINNDYNSAETVTFGNSGSGSVSAMNWMKLRSGKGRLYVGTDVGKVFYTENSSATTPSFTDISNGINGGNISSIVPLSQSSDTVLLTLSNFGINNTYISINGGSTWTAKDGDLPNLPVWWALQNPKKPQQVLIATELGIFGTDDIWASSVKWSPYNSGMGPVKTMQLQFRPSDLTIMAVTHGRGVFTSNAWSINTPVAAFDVSKDTVCSAETISILNNSSNNPTKYSWSISPNQNFKFENGTDSNSTHPKISFSAAGKYTLELTAENSDGKNSISQTLVVLETIPMSLQLISSNNSPCINDTLLLLLNHGSTKMDVMNLTYSWSKNSTIISGANSNVLKVKPPLKNNDVFIASVSTNHQCVSPKTANSNSFKVALKTPSLEIAVNWDTLFPLNYPGFGTVSWYLNGMKIGVGQKIRATKIGRYNAILSWQGCNSDSSNALVLNSVANNLVEKSGINIYPNPSTGRVFIQSQDKLNAIKLYSTDGKLLRNIDLSNGNNSANELIIRSGNLYELQLGSGIYFMECILDESEQNQSVFEKIIVK